MGFRAQLPTHLGSDCSDHVLSLLVLWPLTIVLIAFAARLAGRPDERASCADASIVVSLVEMILWRCALIVCSRPISGRARTATSGFQLVEGEAFGCVRSASSGISASTARASCSSSWPRRPSWRRSSLRTKSGGATATTLRLRSSRRPSRCRCSSRSIWVLFSSPDGRRCCSRWSSSWAGGAASERTVPRRKLGVTGAIGLAALLIALAALSGGSGPSYLVDGTALVHTMSIPGARSNVLCGEDTHPGRAVRRGHVGPSLRRRRRPPRRSFLFTDGCPTRSPTGRRGHRIVIGGVVVALGAVLARCASVSAPSLRGRGGPARRWPRSA